MTKNRYLNFSLRILFVMICAMVYACFFKIIVTGRGFLAMGASGVAVIFSRLIGEAINQESLISVFYMIFYIVINIPLFIFGFNKISKKFIFFTMIYVITFSMTVGFIPESIGTNIGFNELDDLTSAILIGLIGGFSCVGTLFCGGCGGGLDIVSTYLNVKNGKGIGVYSFIFNSSILFLGLLVFKDVPSIIYTLVYAFVSSVILDRYYNRNKKMLLEIVTTKKEEVCNYLLENSHHGCTVLEAKGAYTNEEKFVIHTAISWFQVKSMSKAIKDIDNNCFIINLSINNVNGVFYMPPIK